MSIESKRKSPYQRHGKTPYRYSNEYHNWAAHPSVQTSLVHQRMLIRVFGPAYWVKTGGEKMFSAEAYRSGLFGTTA